MRDRVHDPLASAPDALVMIETTHLHKISRLAPGEIINLTMRSENGPVIFVCPQEEDIITHMTIPSGEERAVRRTGTTRGTPQ